METFLILAVIMFFVLVIYGGVKYYRKLDSIDSRLRDEAIWKRQQTANENTRKWDRARYQQEQQVEYERYTR